MHRTFPAGAVVPFAAQRVPDLARAMLIETDHSIAEIAQALGYEEVNSFRRAFQNWTGLSPGAFRRTTVR